MRRARGVRCDDLAVVDAPLLTVTIDLEDHRPGPTRPARYPDQMRRWLDHLEERDVRATVFVVGAVARRSPDLVVEVAKRGHEVGLHNFDHWALFSCRPDTFARRAGDARAHLEDLTGTAVTGFRAPAGTLVPATAWATDALVEAGFTYSASAVPTQTYGVGFPGCPTTPFRWPSGLAELPCPVLARGGMGMPFLGGTFLRVLPPWVVRRAAVELPADSVPWVYGHPHDIDVLEPLYRVDEVGWWGTVLLWINRGRMLERVDALVEGRVGPPLGERLAAIADDLPTFDPSAATARGPAVAERVAGVLRRDRIRQRLAVPGGLGPAGAAPPAGGVGGPAPGRVTSLAPAS